jgi:hypothetical protein
MAIREGTILSRACGLYLVKLWNDTIITCTHRRIRSQLEVTPVSRLTHQNASRSAFSASEMDVRLCVCVCVCMYIFCAYLLHNKEHRLYVRIYSVCAFCVCVWMGGCTCMCTCGVRGMYVCECGQVCACACGFGTRRLHRKFAEYALGQQQARRRSISLNM